jgi:hypothetical protein
VEWAVVEVEMDADKVAQEVAAEVMVEEDIGNGKLRKLLRAYKPGATKLQRANQRKCAT